MDRGALWTTVHGVTKVGHDQATFMSLHPKLHESKDHICFVFITESLMLSIRLVVQQMVVGLMDEWMNVWTSIKNVFISYCIIFHIQLFSSDQFSSVAQSCLTLQPHESQHARPPCPSPAPGVHSDSRPSSQWCHPAISSSVVPFSSCPQSLPASESFPMSQFFAWGGQSTGVSPLASVLPEKCQGWSLSEWTGWISLQSEGPSGVFSNITV